MTPPSTSLPLRSPPLVGLNHLFLREIRREQRRQYKEKLRERERIVNIPEKEPSPDESLTKEELEEFCEKPKSLEEKKVE